MMKGSRPKSKLPPSTQSGSCRTVFRETPKSGNCRTLLLFSIVVLLSGGATAVRGQFALDGFDPNANGIVRAVVVQADGKIVIGGDFTSVSPNGGAAVTRNRIARFHPNGTLDAAFNPNAENIVYSLAVQADGKLIVGGAFIAIGGAGRLYIARLDGATGLGGLFNPGGQGFARTRSVQAEGKTPAGGG